MTDFFTQPEPIEDLDNVREELRRIGAECERSVYSMMSFEELNADTKARLARLRELP